MTKSDAVVATVVDAIVDTVVDPVFDAVIKCGQMLSNVAHSILQLRGLLRRSYQGVALPAPFPTASVICEKAPKCDRILFINSQGVSSFFGNMVKTMP